MISIKIGANERRFNSINNIDENWVNQQISGLRKDRHSTCVRVSISEEAINLSLSTADCPPSGSGGRPPTDEESKIFDLWDELGLNKKNFHIGKFIVFFKRIRQFIN